jgi:GNAT superfamily N-acetyltransferase
MTTELRGRGPMPTLSVLVAAAEHGLHAWVRDHVPEAVRRAALEEEIGFWLNTAAQDMQYAAAYRANAPQSGEPAEGYLDRWVALGSGAHVLMGPRYLGRNPDLPFVGVSASDRPLTPDDRDQLILTAHAQFAAFSPGFVLLTTSDPIGAWPNTTPEQRDVVGLLRDLRRKQTPGDLTCSPRSNTEFYDRYQAIHAADFEQDPKRTRWTRCEKRADLQALADRGLVFDVLVGNVWAGVMAAEPDTRRGVRGATVVELILDHPYRGQGYGRHLSALLATALPLPDAEALIGTIHAHNVAAYRAALRAGRVDVGGEIAIPL